MVRKQIYITEEQDKQLNEIKESIGIPVARFIRDAIDSHLEERDLNKGMMTPNEYRKFINGKYDMDLPELSTEDVLERPITISELLLNNG